MKFRGGFPAWHFGLCLLAALLWFMAFAWVVNLIRRVF